MASAPLATRDTWTQEQTDAVHNTRALFVNFKLPLGSAKSPAERVVLPTEGVPDGVHLSSELIPVSSNIPKVLLDGRIHPAEVPIFYYSTTKQINPASTSVVLFNHGGGNIAGEPTDFQFLPALSNFTLKLGNVVVAAPSYRCATIPENSFPANLQDTFLAYEHLLKLGYKPENITVAGDSSGGNLALALVHLIASETNLPLPHKLGVFAPASDLTYDFSPFATAQADVDVFPLSVYKEMTAHYLHDSATSTFPKDGPTANSPWKANHPLVSATFIPSFSKERWPKKTLIQVGTADQLIDASRTIAKKLKDAGIDAELIEIPHVPHGFWVFPFFPESVTSYDRLVQFVKA